MTEPDKRIQLRISNQKAYVWDVDDISVLRSQHHICGLVTGTLPHLSQQNAFLGIPLILMPEEVVLLVEKGFAVLVDDPTAHQTPSIEELKAWEEAQAEDVRHQIAASEAKIHALATSGKNKSQSEEAQRKRKERERKRAEALAATATAATSDASEGPPSLSAEPTIEGDGAGGSDSTPTSKKANEPHSTVALPPHTITVPASSNETLSWYRPSGHVYESIADARAAGVWSYPTSLHERAQCGVFRDLWEKGYFMGIGIKFGGNYLVYPGDPLRYHSHFVATVLDSPTSTLRPMEIVAHGRLGTATKKAHLLCGWDDESGQVSYYSIEWAGFG